MDLTLSLLADSKRAKEALGDFQSGLLATAKVVKDFAKESIQAYAEAERTQRQLQIAAGKYTATLNEQAEALKQKFAVDDDEIKHMDVLLLRYGAAPAAIEKTTEAVLNYAAATGKNATQAMEQLIRGVESGTGSLGKMGVHFQTTGKFSTDLAAAVEALNKKFGGAGEEDAQSLHGRMRQVELAADDVKKSFGAMFDEFDRRHGVLSTVAKGLNEINKELQDEGLGVLLGLKSSRMNTKRQLENTGGAFGLFDKDDPRWQEALANAQTRDAMADLRSRELVGMLKSKGLIPSNAGQVDEALPTTSDADHAVGNDASRKAAAKKAQDEFERQLHAENEYLDKKWLAEVVGQEKHDEEMLEQKRARAKLELQIAEDELKRENEIENFYAQKRLDEEEQQTKDLQKLGDLQFQYMQEQTDKQKLELERRNKMWMSAGMQIGAAVINGIFEAIQLAMSGEGDKSRGAIKITQSIFNAIFSAFGMGWMSNLAFSSIGAAESGGPLAGFGSFAAGGAAYGAQMGFSSGSTSKTFSDQDLSASGYSPPPSQHTGGWIEKYHFGGPVLGRDERLAVLQEGETVFSRADVARNGGRVGVEAMRMGGGSGRPLIIQAFDTSSILDFFGDRGGRGMLNAQRANVGPLRLAFGKV